PDSPAHDIDTLSLHDALPISFRTVVKIGGWLNRIDDYFGQRHTVLDELYHDLLSDFSEERRRELIAFIEGVSTDQSLVFQLTARSEEHTSELQSRENLVCRLL